MFSPAADRNKAPIYDALQPRLSRVSRLLEIACGSLQHACFMAPKLTHLTWLPTDIDPAAIEFGQSLHARPANVAAPERLDVHDNPWPFADVDAIYTANLLHISPSSVLGALFLGAGRVLKADGHVYIYGPFKRAGEHTSTGNAAFDQDLRARNADWGIRDLAEVMQAAAQAGFVRTDEIAMPANNLLLEFRSAS